MCTTWWIQILLPGVSLISTVNTEPLNEEGTCPGALPNVVLVVADDLGWGDVGFSQGSEGFDPGLGVPDTPYLDKAAKEGLVLENLYTQAACTPTRGSLMTGKYAYRLGKLFSTSVMRFDDKGPSDRLLSEVSLFISSELT